jgi:phenylpyruvate tautomerase PptA (4-oxalocrotonate tautomerase family)
MNLGGGRECGRMPYLQVDLPGPASADVKRRFAQRLAELYAAAMLTQPHIPSIAFRELGPDNLVRLQDGVLTPVVVVMCDIRRGREPAIREALARAIAAECSSAFGIDERQVVVEFTQHTPDEMFRYGNMAPEWSPAEAIPGALK